MIDITNTTDDELPPEVAIARAFARAMAGLPAIEFAAVVASDGTAPGLPGSPADGSPGELQHRVTSAAELGSWAKAHDRAALAEFLSRPVDAGTARLVVLARDFEGCAVCEPSNEQPEQTH